MSHSDRNSLALSLSRTIITYTSSLAKTVCSVWLHIYTYVHRREELWAEKESKGWGNKNWNMEYILSSNIVMVGIRFTWT